MTGILCTRCTPLSYFIFVQASSPFKMKITSLNPPVSELLWLRHSTVQPCFSAYLVYIRNKSPAKIEASSPPAPALISTIVFLPTSGSGGSIAISSFSLFSDFCLFRDSSSIFASSPISGSSINEIHWDIWSSRIIFSSNNTRISFNLLCSRDISVAS